MYHIRISYIHHHHHNQNHQSAKLTWFDFQITMEFRYTQIIFDIINPSPIIPQVHAMQFLPVVAIYTDTQTGLTQPLLHVPRRTPVLIDADSADQCVGGNDEDQPYDDYTVLGEVAYDDHNGKVNE